MPSYSTFIKHLIPVLSLSLIGCDNLIDKSAYNELNHKVESQQKKIELLEKQQIDTINNTKSIIGVVNDIDKKQKALLFTEFNPSLTRYFIINNGSIGLAGRILSIEPITDGSVIHMDLVNLLSIPVSHIGFHMTWGGEMPTDMKDAKALASWKQMLVSTSMKSSIELLPGQWTNIKLTLKGFSPNNLRYLKMSMNMENVVFERTTPVKNPSGKNKK
ncbi:hypothetical protein [Salmonella enterica]|uniref:hypothetical protein n=1 Tax=Salmonella enterica TaxID=28901 RepID=UPI00370A407E